MGARKSKNIKLGHGGHRPGAGRPKGAKNKLTLQLEAAFAVAEGELGEGHSPLMYMLAVMQDLDNPVRVRLRAARALLPFFHRKLPPLKPEPVHFDIPPPQVFVLVPPFPQDDPPALDGESKPPVRVTPGDAGSP
jgi:hypothetical protein